MTCRKYHGSAFNPFVVFRFDQVLISGTLRPWRSSDHATRLSCVNCSSPICYEEDHSDEIELNLGAFDDASLFTPMYENWAVRREAWLPHFGLPERKTDPNQERRQRDAAREATSVGDP